VSSPEMVPVPSKSPARSGQPVIVWCAIICEKEKRRFEEEVWEILWVPDWAVGSLLVKKSWEEEGGGGGRVAFYGDCERDIVYALTVRFLEVGEQRYLRPSLQRPST